MLTFGFSYGQDSFIESNNSYPETLVANLEPSEEVAYTKIHGKLNGEVVYYTPEKQVKTKGWFVENKRHSKWVAYFNDGSKKAEVGYVLGKKHGEWKLWDNDGNLRYQYSYYNGKPVGEWKMYDEQGLLVQHIVHDN